MRFFVLVNGRFIVKVDNHSSNVGAEHEILDNINGAQTALAFDEDAIKSEYFRTWLLKEETVLVDSPFDLEGIFYKLTSAKRYLEVCENDVKELRKFLEEEKKRLVDCENAFVRAQEKLKDAHEDVENAKADLNIKDN